LKTAVNTSAMYPGMEENLGDIGNEQGREDVQGREDKVSVVDSFFTSCFRALQFPNRASRFPFKEGW
jgi:hypothetical protein